VAVQNKAARGKHRWVGLIVDLPGSENELKKLLAGVIGENNWQVLDAKTINAKLTAIVKIPLEEYSQGLNSINEADGFSTITSSGKLRLVRLRISRMQES
tara:strand:+ start:18534 stop:18833 length:300 start_codon:yes stop_codon:yes gene_type:complete